MIGVWSGLMRPPTEVADTKKPRRGEAFWGPICSLLLKRDTSRPHQVPEGMCTLCSTFLQFFNLQEGGIQGRVVAQPPTFEDRLRRGPQGNIVLARLRRD